MSYGQALARPITFLKLRLRLFEPSFSTYMPHLAQSILVLCHSRCGPAGTLPRRSQRLEFVAVVLEHICELLVKFCILLTHLADESILLIFSFINKCTFNGEL